MKNFGNASHHFQHCIGEKGHTNDLIFKGFNEFFFAKYYDHHCSVEIY